jgi:O-antigen/teichoic acid export membrane protein
MAVASDVAEPAAAVAPAGLKKTVLSGLGWKLLSQLVLQGSKVAVGLVLAHMLTAHEFGVAAMALAFSGLALVFSDPGLGAALIQKRTLTEADRSTVFWTTVAAGLLCTAAGIGFSSQIAAFFGEPSVRPLVIVESLTFMLVALSATQTALMAREMNFRALELRDMAGNIAGGLCGVALAIGGAGAWAIIGQSVASAALATILLWHYATWKPKLVFSRKALKENGSFGGKLFVTRILSYLNLNADNLLVGRYLGTAALGIYALAYNVMFAPLARIAGPIQQVLIPAFSRLQDDTERLGRVWLRGSRLSAAVSVPAFLGMLAVAPDFVPVILGDRWLDAVPVLQLLCWAGILQGIQLLQWSVLQARGRAGALLRYAFMSTGVNVAAFAIGLHWGIVGVAAGFAIARTVMVPFITRLTCRELGLRLGDFPRALASVMRAAAAMVAAVLLARVGLVELGVPAAARLPLLVLVGAASYGAILFWRAPDVMRELKALRKDGAEAED